MLIPGFVQAEPTTASSESRPIPSSSTQAFYLGAFINQTQVDATTLLDESSLDALETSSGSILKRMERWHWIEDREAVRPVDVLNGNLLFVALTISRAEVTRTTYKALGITRYTARAVLSLDFFNPLTRSVFFSFTAAGVRSHRATDAEADQVDESILVIDTLEALVLDLVKKTDQDLDPDLIHVDIREAKNGLWLIRTDNPIGVGPGHVFHTVERLCVAREQSRPCRLVVDSVSDGQIYLEAEDKAKLCSGTHVYSYWNKKDPPGIFSFQVESFGSASQTSLHEGDLSFLKNLFHCRLAESGRVRVISPVDICWGRRANERLAQIADIAQSELDESLVRTHPSYHIRGGITVLKRRLVRENRISGKEAFIASVAARVFKAPELHSSKVTGHMQMPVSEILHGQALVENRILPGKTADERALYLVAIQNAMDVLVDKMIDVMEPIGRGSPTPLENP